MSRRTTRPILALALAAAAVLAPAGAALRADDDGRPFQIVTGDGFRGAIVPEPRARELAAGWGIEADRFFTPTAADIEALEAGVVTHLVAAAPPESPELWKKVPSYVRQYAGIFRDGKKLVLVSFLCDGDEDDDWKTSPVVVDDGGDCFFRLLYEPATKAFSGLTINGDA